MDLNVQQLRYIVFVIDSTFDDHDGKVFSDVRRAREFIKDCTDNEWASKFIIGSFINDGTAEMEIHFIEEYGYKKKITDKNQLSLFK